MPLHHIYRKQDLLPINKSAKTSLHITPLIIFSLLMFFISLGDAIMSYSAPIFIENYTQSTIMMGLILSFSSFSGMILDFLIDENFWNRNYSFFTKSALITTILFPLCFLVFNHSIPVFLVAMFMWGSYYEFRGYAMFNFINTTMDRSEHTRGWSTLNGYKALAYFIGPLIATNALNLGFKFTFGTALIAFLPAILIYFFSKGLRKSYIKISHKHVKSQKRSFFGQLGILRALMHKIWPMFLFSFMIIVVDACFWTVGTLFSQELKQTNWLGAYLLVAYMLPPIFSKFFTDRINVQAGKKKTSFIYGLVAAVFLVAIGTTDFVPLIILYVFLMSLFINIAFILHASVIEDYMDRLVKSGHSNDLVTLEQMSGSFAYIIGPTLMGFLAYFIGFTQTFAVTGVLMGIISFICFIIVPLKIKMPQKELASLSE